jgi:expansin
LYSCSFSDYPHDTGVSNGVALGLQQWFGAAGCGACVNITGPSGSVIAMVNDQVCMLQMIWSIWIQYSLSGAPSVLSVLITTLTLMIAMARKLILIIKPMESSTSLGRFLLLPLAQLILFTNPTSQRDFIPCPLSGNIQFKNKEGTSAYYFAMQVRNSVLPIDTLEVSTDGGSTWTNVEREEYNYFTSYS